LDNLSLQSQHKILENIVSFIQGETHETCNLGRSVEGVLLRNFSCVQHHLCIFNPTFSKLWSARDL